MKTLHEISLDKEPLFVPRVLVNKGEKWIKHVRCDGARFHVLHWYGGIGLDGKTYAGCRCSEPDCIINKLDNERKK